MKTPLRIIGIVTALLVVGAVAYFAGRSQNSVQGIDQLKRETAGNLGMHVEMLARIRTGDVDGAVSLLEGSVDTAVGTLPQGKSFSQQTDTVQNVLMASRAYRDSFPTTNAAAAKVLKDVPPLPADHVYCSKALGAVVKKSGANGGS
ncbi:MAG: hypothetical protein ACREIT_01185 [Tepidisphaeraceae bacterium]